ncbi:MAG: tetratricopeptide repeat-containing sensor histidine kinase [Bacteroidales bacterium]|nr:tetratricopeptide repeat-containing sensor histidine kinase [Bacteroidales bacterium]
MKYLVGFIVLYILSLGATDTAYGADSKLDSLRTEVHIARDDTNKVLQLKSLSYKYLKVQLDTSYVLCKKSITLSKKLDYSFGYATSLNQMGLVFKYMAQFDSSLYYYKKSLILFDSLKIDSERASVLNRMANVYKRYGEYELSIESFTKSLKVYKELEDSVGISSVLNNIGILYNELGDYEKSLEYELQGLEIKKKLNSWSNIPIALMNIGNNYEGLHEYDKAILHYKEALDLIGEDGNKYDKSLLVHNIALINEATEDYRSAKQYYLIAIQLEKEINFKEMLVFSLQGLGNSLIKEGSFKDGEKYLLQSYDLAKEIKDVRKEHRLSRNLYEVYFNYGDYKNSIFYLREFVALEDSIYSFERKAQIVELEQKFETEKRKQQIAFLEKEQEIHQLELSKKEIENKQKSFQRNALVILVIMVVSLLIYYFIDSKKRKKLNRLLLKQNEKITDQRTEIANQNKDLLESNNTKDRLFQIIAHDLRSPLVSMESITQLVPYWIEEQDFESLSRLSKTLELSVNNVLSLIDNLLNWALNQQGKFPYKPENLKLKENIAETIDVYRPIAQMKNINLKLQITKNVMVFADRNMLFTVMRNLLNNAIKFTPEKGEIIVGVDSNQQYAKIWVADSGIGIPDNKKDEIFELANGRTKDTKGETGKGLGLFFCKEFVKLNNGDIYIESEKGKGTKITFTLPLFNIAEN